eukprot:2877026-Karenia_brevis.AAC.1
MRVDRSDSLAAGQAKRIKDGQAMALSNWSSTGEISANMRRSGSETSSPVNVFITPWRGIRRSTAGTKAAAR